jgi:hypothetical protein
VQRRSRAFARYRRGPICHSVAFPGPSFVIGSCTVPRLGSIILAIANDDLFLHIARSTGDLWMFGISWWMSLARRNPARYTSPCGLARPAPPLDDKQSEHHTNCTRTSWTDSTSQEDDYNYSRRRCALRRMSCRDDCSQIAMLPFNNNASADDTYRIRVL